MGNLNLTATISHDSRNVYPVQFTGPLANINDGNDATICTGGATVVSGDRSVGLQSDLGTLSVVTSIRWRAYGGGAPEILESSLDGVTWDVCAGSWSNVGDVYTFTPTGGELVTQYFAVRWLYSGGLGYFGWPDV